jgi:hypothetical protein
VFHQINYPKLLTIDQYLVKAKERLVGAGMPDAEVQETLSLMRIQLIEVSRNVDGIY